MIRFESDYTEGAHIRILERLAATNLEQTPGYGKDIHCATARAHIKQACKDEAIDVHFLVGGTQTNATVIAAALRPHQGVISALTGHINAHETGAIEATGHKVLVVESPDGKIRASQVAQVCADHWNDSDHEHTVQPGMVYISHPSENGTIYTKKELEEISAVCRKWELPLFLDGARLGYGLAAPGNDLTLEDINRLCDVFYIGGTKVGALFGEALVIKNESLKRDFRYHIKQRGGMLAKGRLLGIQFETLFEDGLYYEIAQYAVEMAMKIRQAFADKGFAFLYDSPTNQQFPILPREALEQLSAQYSYSPWAEIDKDHMAVRFCTSWATKEENVQRLLDDIKAL